MLVRIYRYIMYVERGGFCVRDEVFPVARLNSEHKNSSCTKERSNCMDLDCVLSSGQPYKS